MFLQVLLLALAVLQVANSAALQDDKIDAVDLNCVCVRIQGKDEEHKKSPILLIHGLTSSLHNWDGVQQVLALRTGRRVCAIDLRNHGESPWSNRTDIEAMAVDVGHFLDKQNIKKVNLIGHSLGEKTVIHYALKNPDRVDSLVVEDMRPNSFSQKSLQLAKVTAKLFLEAIESIPEGSTEDETRNIIVDFLNKKLEELGLKDKIDKEDADNLELNCRNGKCGLKMNPYLLQKFAEDPTLVMTVSKGLYEGPTLFIYGTLSPALVNEDEKEILKLFPNANLVGVKGAGHTIHGKFRTFEDEVIKLMKN